MSIKKVGAMIKKVLTRLKPVWNPRKVWNMWEHTGWGNRIAWMDFSKQSVEGHIHGIQEDDELRSKMQSGKIARFKIINLDYQHDPADQFFADASFVGYVEGVSVNPITGEFIEKGEYNG